MDTHKHQCGLTAYGFDPSKGCGHIWEHPDPDGTETSAVYAARHVCPNCGKRNQRYRMTETDEKLHQKSRQTGEEILFAIIAAALRRTLEEEKDERLSKRRT